jgi:cytochrome c-type biogenesis protein
MLTTLVLAAAAAGVTGAWSPCGFSMVETLAPAGYAGRLRTTLAACVTFAAGALAGGAVTFGGLALLGHALGAGGPGALAIAAAVAVAAAVGEARGARILPQVRRQVPESWRRRMPVPLAAGLYGVLLGLGFTTFILTFAVWALAGVCVAVGDPALGLAVGLAFGAGRLLPVVALAPTAGTARGGALHAAMAERPQILRSLRAVDAVALAACAVVLVA